MKDHILKVELSDELKQKLYAKFKESGILLGSEGSTVGKINNEIYTLIIKAALEGKTIDAKKEIDNIIKRNRIDKNKTPCGAKRCRHFNAGLELNCKYKGKECIDRSKYKWAGTQYKRKKGAKK